MGLIVTGQIIHRRNGSTPKASLPGLHEVPIESWERASTRLTVRRLFRRIRGRLHAGSDEWRHEPDAADIASTLISVLHSHDRTARDHAGRTRLLAEGVASELGLDPETTRTTSYATALHDIGKICVPGPILNKPGRLDEGEWRIIRRHPEIGAGILLRIGVSERVSSAVLTHHERFDGRGYPAGLSGEDIPIEARIISVVDAYDAMTSDRPYRKAMKSEEALAEIEGNSGAQFCPTAVKALLSAVGRTRSAGQK